MVRNKDGNILDPELTSTISLFRAHEKASKQIEDRIQEEKVKLPPHQGDCVLPLICVCVCLRAAWRATERRVLLDSILGQTLQQEYPTHSLIYGIFAWSHGVPVVCQGHPLPERQAGSLNTCQVLSALQLAHLVRPSRPAVFIAYASPLRKGPGQHDEYWPCGLSIFLKGVSGVIPAFYCKCCAEEGGFYLSEECMAKDKLDLLALLCLNTFLVRHSRRLTFNSLRTLTSGLLPFLVPELLGSLSIPGSFFKWHRPEGDLHTTRSSVIVANIER